MKIQKKLSWVVPAFVAVAVFILPTGLSAQIPGELYEALGISESASPKVLYEKVTARYHSEEAGAGKGKFAEHWEPIAFSKYLDPGTFYKPPTSIRRTANRSECVSCHTDESPGYVAGWKKSAHANISAIRNLTPDDPTYYKLAKLEEVEKNLRSMGKLKKGEQLTEVNCMDCHVGVGAQSANHAKDLRLPDAAACGTCHLTEFAQRESERDTITWPDGQWPKGRPSHALDYRANVETGIWAGMEQREVAEGCTGCHQSQNKCDTCHTRHQFSSVEARKPEACSTCHNGIDHNNYDNYMGSKHGVIYTTLGDSWNWEVPLKDAVAKGGQTAPTCASCHMEYDGEFSHNMVRKVRWANYPAAGGIAENITSAWSEERKEAWIDSCKTCHSESFSLAYFDIIDKVTLQGLEKFQEAFAVAEKLYNDGLMPGQKTNRPPPPAPKEDGFAQFYQMFWTKGNNPSNIEFEALAMGENQLAKLHVAVAHVNWGNYSYSDGWEQLQEAYTKIMQADTQLREFDALKKRVANLETKVGWFDLDSEEQKAVGGLGGGMFLFGTTFLGWRNRKKLFKS